MVLDIIDLNFIPAAARTHVSQKNFNSTFSRNEHYYEPTAILTNQHQRPESSFFLHLERLHLICITDLNTDSLFVHFNIYILRHVVISA